MSDSSSHTGAARPGTPPGSPSHHLLGTSTGFRSRPGAEPGHHARQRAGDAGVELGPVTVVAHRGASGYAPENTIAALEQAIAQGADFVEVDVQLTADGEAVLVHDVTVARTTDAATVFPDRAPWNVGDLTLAELRRLDAGSWFDPAYAAERVPTLREALDVMRDRIGLWLELKSPKRHPGLTKVVAEVLRTAPGDWLTAPGRCVASSFDHEALARFAEEVGFAVPFGWLGSTVPSDAELAELPSWVSYVIPDCRALRPGDLTRARAAGLRTALWTPNDSVTIASLVAQGASALIGNYPEVVRQVLDRGRYEVEGAPLAVERLTGGTAVLRNVAGRPVATDGWFLRGDPAGRTDVPGAQLPVGGALEVSLPRTDSVALHAPDGAVVDVVARVEEPEAT